MENLITHLDEVKGENRQVQKISISDLTSIALKGLSVAPDNRYSISFSDITQNTLNLLSVQTINRSVATSIIQESNLPLSIDEIYELELESIGKYSAIFQLVKYGEDIISYKINNVDVTTDVKNAIIERGAGSIKTAIGYKLLEVMTENNLYNLVDLEDRLVMMSNIQLRFSEKTFQSSVVTSTSELSDTLEYLLEDMILFSESSNFNESSVNITVNTVEMLYAYQSVAVIRLTIELK